MVLLYRQAALTKFSISFCTLTSHSSFSIFLFFLLSGLLPLFSGFLLYCLRGLAGGSGLSSSPLSCRSKGNTNLHEIKSFNVGPVAWFLYRQCEFESGNCVCKQHHLNANVLCVLALPAVARVFWVVATEWFISDSILKSPTAISYL